MRSIKQLLLLGAIALLLAAPVAAQSAYVNFEGAQTNPVRLSPDGTRLFAVNTADARLSVFDLTQPAAPALMVEIPVGIEPVSVNARSNDEAWVVNQVSDSISVISVARGLVTDTIRVKDEPADVVFAGTPLRAFVTVARSNEVRVFDLDTHAQLAVLPIFGLNPRALAVSPDGAKVYAACALSGNGTTIIPASAAPPPPAPTNATLPPAPQQGLIVDALDPLWRPGHIQYALPDNDVVEIDAAALSVTRYFTHVGTVNMGLAVQPGTGDLFVANTDALNLVRFEPNLRGHVVENRITRVSLADGTLTHFELNPALDYTLLPNNAAKATALAQPTAVVFAPDGSAFYVAAFGTDRVARLSSDGQILARIEVGPATGASVAPRTKRGPRGLALNVATARLYVLNRIANTLSVIDTTRDAVLKELPLGRFDPTPAVIREGRGFLYDAKLSGNGTAACAACHIDADMDFLAWDLGQPGGTVQRVTNNGNTFNMHPMKGPMTTQTLRGLSGVEPLHWRGDRADLLAFNPAFASLLGGVQLSSADNTTLRDFVNTIKFQPNPNQNLDRTLPAALAGGDPNAGRNTFINEPFVSNVTCNTCHTAPPGTGTNRAIISAALLRESQDMKVPQLRNIYQKLQFNDAAGAESRAGFGLTHDGAIATLFEFLSQPVFALFANDRVRQTNLQAFMLCFDTGMAPAVGYARTLTAENVGTAPAQSDWSLLQAQAAAGNVDLIGKGTIDGQLRGLLYRPPTDDYQSDHTGVGPFTRAQLQTRIGGGDTLTIMGVPAGSGRRMGIDRDSDGTLDSDPLPPPAPAAPNNLTATAVSTTQIKLTWVDNAGNEDSFSIERCAGATCTNFAPVAQVGANVTNFAQTGLTRNTTYRFRVRASNTGGASAYSNSASAKTFK